MSSLPGDLHHNPVLTRDVKVTLTERMLRDPPFAAALEDEAKALMQSSKPGAARLAAEWA